MKAYWGMEVAPCILNFSTRWRWVVSFTTRPLYPQYPLDRRLGGPQSQSGRGGEEKNPSPCRKQNPGRPPCTLKWMDYLKVGVTCFEIPVQQTKKYVI